MKVVINTLLILLLMVIFLVSCSTAKEPSESKQEQIAQLESCETAEDKSQCYIFVAMDLEDTRICDLLDTDGRFNCYILVATKANDVKICDKLSDKYYCYSSIAWKSKDPKICEALNQSDKERCYELYQGFMREEDARKEAREPTEDGFLTYEKHGIKAEYPQNWGIEELNLGAQSGAKFWSHQQDPSDTFSENVVVVVAPLDPPISLKEFTEQNIEELENTIPNVKILTSTDSMLDKNQAHMLIVTYSLDQLNLKSLQVWTVKDNKAYLVTYVAKVEEYDTFLETAQKIMSSFEII